MKIEPATDADFLAFYGREAPETWLGMAAKEGERIVGMGVVIWNENGCAMGFVDRKGPVSAMGMHRAVKRVLGILKQVGEPAVYVTCDHDIPRADYWLKRLGFKPMDSNPEVWQVVL